MQHSELFALELNADASARFPSGTGSLSCVQAET